MVSLHCQGHNKPITAMVLSEGTIYSAGGALDSHISILCVFTQNAPGSKMASNEFLIYICTL